MKVGSEERVVNGAQIAGSGDGCDGCDSEFESVEVGCVNVDVEVRTAKIFDACQTYMITVYVA